jgi:hypothetical protein
VCGALSLFLFRLLLVVNRGQRWGAYSRGYLLGIDNLSLNMNSGGGSHLDAVYGDITTEASWFKCDTRYGAQLGRAHT